MNHIDRSHSDDDLLSALDQLLDLADPVPAGLVDRIQFAVALEDLDVEVARWERADALAGVRGTDPGSVTFTLDDLTVMITFTAQGADYRIDGWLVPGGEHRVEVRVAGHRSVMTTADSSGRFILVRVPCGTLQMIVQLVEGGQTPSRTVVTPTLLLGNDFQTDL